MQAEAIKIADPAGALMPWLTIDERKLRNRLLRLQQYSTTRALQSQSPTAKNLFWLINSTASANATAPASREELGDLWAGLCRLSVVADMFERHEASNECA